MRALILAVTALLFTATFAFAETRIFVVVNEADGYGIDRCLAHGERCGAAVANAYCQSRAYHQAASYNRVAPDEVTGTLAEAPASCAGEACRGLIAITCER